MAFSPRLAVSFAALSRLSSVPDPDSSLPSCVPSLHDRYSSLGYYERSDPDRLLSAARRGSLIHVTLTSDPSVSNPLWLSVRRYPLTPRRRLYFVWASPFTSRLASNHRPNRVHLRIPMESHRYGLVIRFPLLPTRGYCPDAVTFSYWPLSVGQLEDSHLAVKMRSQAH